MKKLMPLFFYLIIGIFFLFIYYYNETGIFWNSLKYSDNSGGPLYIFWVKYLKYADSWNFFFFLIFVASFLVFMTFIDTGITKLCSTNTFLNKKWIRDKRWVRTVQIFLSSAILFIGVVIFSNIIVVRYGKKHAISIDEVKKNSIILILGTNKYLSSNKSETKKNLYFIYRINAAKRLWDACKVRKFIVSGEKKGQVDYDETKDITNELLSFGVPENVIEIDTSGLRTHDSMIGLRNFCAQLHTREVVIVSQKFHTQRAVFMAPFFGINAKAYNAKGSPTFAMYVREFFSKPKVMIDLFITNIKPKEQSLAEYREKFEIKSQAHILLILSVIGAFISTIIFLTKYIDRVHQIKI